MATIFRTTYTQHLPMNAKVTERNGKPMTLWYDRRGRRHYNRVTTGRHGEARILRHRPTWIARYRDADGNPAKVSTGCRDETAARQVLANLLRRVEFVKAGLFSPQQDRMATHARRTVIEHVADYLEHLRAKTVRGKRLSPTHRENVKRQLRRLVDDCGFRHLSDIHCDALEKWMNRKETEGMGARTRNTYRSAILAFVNWCTQTDRLPANPLVRLSPADDRSDRRRRRRALTEAEIQRLLVAARLRPLAEHGRVHAPKPKEDCPGRSTWYLAPLTWDNLEITTQHARQILVNQPELVTKLERRGRERSLIYKTLVLTGLRRGELASRN